MVTSIPGRSDVRSALPVLRWADAALHVVVFGAWLALVLRFQYGVDRLQPYDITSDALFVFGVIGIVLLRVVSRSGSIARSLLRMTVAGVTTVMALVGAEYVARWQYRHARSSRNAGDYVARRGGGPAVRLNALGFREREIPPKSNRFRIAIVGDSFTWGNGLEERERYSNVLGDVLGDRYEVFNFGVPGNNMPEHLDVLQRALTIAPDYILLQLYINDFETPEMTRPRAYALLPDPLNGSLEQSSLLYDLANDEWSHLQQLAGLSEGYVQYMERNLRDPHAPNAREAYGHLAEFFDRARTAAVPAGSVLFPAIDALGPYARSYPFGYLHDGVRRVCADEHVQCLDLLPTFSGFPDARVLWVSPFDAHPDAMASRRAANAIAGYFGTDWSR